MTNNVEISGNNNNGFISRQDKKPIIGLRWILVWIIFLTLAFIFFVRNCVSVAIVAMVNSTSTSDDEEPTSDACPAAINNTDSDEDSEGGEYTWTNAEQGFVLGAYFWGFIISRLLLSRICEKFGQRQSMSLGLAISAILTLLSPLCSDVSPYLLAVNRFFIGICYGPNPAIYQCLFAAWSPEDELGILTTVAYSGSLVGGMLCLLLSGWLSENFGWRSIFYVSGALVLLLPPLWIFLVRNTPGDHPWLSNYERELLKDNMNIKTQENVPWKKIIFSPYVTICLICLFAREWITILVAIEGPSFLAYKIGLDLDTASYVNGGSSLMSLISSLIFGVSSDIIIKRNYLSKTNSRKLFHFIGTGIPPFVLLGIIFADCDQTTVIVLWIILGFFLSGTMLSCVLTTIDLAPNHTAAVNGMMALSTLAGSIEPSVTSAFIKTGNGWDKTFYLTIAISVVSCILFLLFMTAEPQPWNFSEDVIIMAEPQPWIFSEDKRESIASNGEIEGIDESKVNDGAKHHSPLPFKLTDRKASIFTPY